MRSSGIEITCLICNWKTVSMSAHQMHLKMKHRYLEDRKGQEDSGVEHRKIKERVKKIDGKAVVKLGEGRARYETGEFKCISHRQAYNAVEYEEERCAGDLVWRYVFEKHRDAQYYYLSTEEQEKAIEVTGHILVRG